MMTGQHLRKLILRIDPQLSKDIDNAAQTLDHGGRALAYATVTSIAAETGHVWSSNTFTVVFLKSGYMGASKRSASDQPDLERAIRIACSRAVAGFLLSSKLEWEDALNDMVPADQRDTIVPIRRGDIPGENEQISMQEELLDAASKFVQEERAKQALVRRDERNISHALGRRFRF